jgi:hypothetical protein
MKKRKKRRKKRKKKKRKKRRKKRRKKKKKNLFTSKLDLNLSKKLIKCCSWRMYGAETSTFRKVIRNTWRKFLNVVLQNNGEA